jgi:hypothetical protein
MEQLLEELQQMQQFVLLYPPQGEKGPNRVTTVIFKQTLQNSPWPKLWVWISSSILPNEGNTSCRLQVLQSTRLIRLLLYLPVNSR